MAKKGEQIRHSLRRGETTYPIKNGNIVRLKQPIIKRNKHAKTGLPHEVFIWIHKIVDEVDGPRNIQQPVRVAIYYIPTNPGNRDFYLVEQKKIKKKSIIKKFQLYGYELVGKSVFNNTVACFARARKIIGLD